METHQAIRSFNPELDRKVGDIQIPSLCLVEGANDSGKSVFCMQYCYGALQSGLRCNYITTETSMRNLVQDMGNLSWNVLQNVISGDLKVSDLHVKTLTWTKRVSLALLNVIVSFMRHEDDYQVFFLDSLTYLLTHSDSRSVLNFLTQLRNLVDEERKTVFMTIHPYATDQDTFLRLRSISDAHFVLSVREVGDRLMRVLQVMKLKGASKGGLTMTFEVDQAFGIRVLPFSQAKA